MQQGGVGAAPFRLDTHKPNSDCSHSLSDSTATSGGRAYESGRGDHVRAEKEAGERSYGEFDS